jgi:hypothetical protein
LTSLLVSLFTSKIVGPCRNFFNLNGSPLLGASEFLQNHCLNAGTA